MKLYRPIEVGEFDHNHFYNVHGIYRNGYLCGQFGCKTEQDDNSVILTFFGMLFVDYAASNPSRHLLPVDYFDTSKVKKHAIFLGQRF